MQMLFNKLGVALACALIAPAAMSADAYPSRPVTLVVAFAPGGPTDVLARIVGLGLGKALGQPVVVENRPGGGGMLGTKDVARARADGYTVLFAGDTSLTVSPQLSRHAGYDAQKDFTPLRIVASQSNVLVANRSKGITSVADLIAQAKLKPGAITFGSAGVGTPSHLIGALFAGQAGIEMLHVPYKGAGPAMTDLLGGQIDTMFVGMPVALQNANRKELALLAVTGDTRLPALPNVPTFAEAGIPTLGANTAIWWGVMAPAGLPDSVRQRLDLAVQTAMNDPEVRTRLQAQGVDALNLDAAAMRTRLAQDHAKWAKVIQEQKISIE